MSIYYTNCFLITLLSLQELSARFATVTAIVEVVAAASGCQRVHPVVIVVN